MKRKVTLRKPPDPVPTAIAAVFGTEPTLKSGLWYVPYMGSRLAFESDGTFLAAGPILRDRKPKFSKAEAEFVRQEIDSAVDLYRRTLKPQFVNPGRQAQEAARARRVEAAERAVAAQSSRASADVRRAAADRDMTVGGYARREADRRGMLLGQAVDIRPELGRLVDLYLQAETSEIERGRVVPTRESNYTPVSALEPDSGTRWDELIEPSTLTIVLSMLFRQGTPLIPVPEEPGVFLSREGVRYTIEVTMNDGQIVSARRVQLL